VINNLLLFIITKMCKCDFAYIPWLIIPLIFLYMGLYVIIKKKPLYNRRRTMVFLTFLIFLFPILKALLTGDTDYYHLIIPALIILIFMGFFYYTSRGISIMGVNGEDFQNTLTEVLHDNNYEYEQSISSVKIIEPEMEIYISIQPWLGSAHLRKKGRGNIREFNKLIRELKLKKIKVNYFFPVFQILFAALFIYFGIVSVFY
jgi:hypothetical protein